MPETIKRLCQYCGKTFMIAKHRIKHGRGKYCSSDCSYKSRTLILGKKIDKICLNCRNVFYISQSAAARGRGKYCSRECRREYLNEITTCKKCNKEFSAYKSAQQSFCSKECADSSEEKRERSKERTIAQWSNPESRAILEEGIKVRSQSPEWRSAPHFQSGKAHPRYKGSKRDRTIETSRYPYVQWRTSVFKRDNYTCQRCGSHGKKLNAHHIKSWSDHPELRYDIENGVTVCKNCHGKIHGLTFKPRSKICEYCEQKFSPKKSRQRFCSLTCFHKSDSCYFNRKNTKQSIQHTGE